jgi:hypothetical protein
VSVSPADFELYSRVTGTPIPRTPAERMRLAPTVQNFIRQQGYAQQGNVLQDVAGGLFQGALTGAGIIGAGALAASLGGRGANQAIGGRRFSDLRDLGTEGTATSAPQPQNPPSGGGSGVQVVDLGSSQLRDSSVVDQSPLGDRIRFPGAIDDDSQYISRPVSTSPEPSNVVTNQTSTVKDVRQLNNEIIDQNTTTQAEAISGSTNLLTQQADSLVNEIQAVQPGGELSVLPDTGGINPQARTPRQLAEANFMGGVVARRGGQYLRRGGPLLGGVGIGAHAVGNVVGGVADEGNAITKSVRSGLWNVVPGVKPTREFVGRAATGVGDFTTGVGDAVSGVYESIPGFIRQPIADAATTGFHAIPGVDPTLSAISKGAGALSHGAGVAGNVLANAPLEAGILGAGIAADSAINDTLYLGALARQKWDPTGLRLPSAVMRDAVARGELASLLRNVHSDYLVPGGRALHSGVLVPTGRMLGERASADYERGVIKPAVDYTVQRAGDDTRLLRGSASQFLADASQKLLVGDEYQGYDHPDVAPGEVSNAPNQGMHSNQVQGVDRTDIWDGDQEVAETTAMLRRNAATIPPDQIPEVARQVVSKRRAERDQRGVGERAKDFLDKTAMRDPFLSGLFGGDGTAFIQETDDRTPQGPATYLVPDKQNGSSTRGFKGVGYDPETENLTTYMKVSPGREEVEGTGVRGYETPNVTREEGEQLTRGAEGSFDDPEEKRSKYRSSLRAAMQRKEDTKDK